MEKNTKRNVAKKSPSKGNCLFYVSSFLPVILGFSGGSVVKNLHANTGDTGLIPGSGRSPRGNTGNPLQCSARRIPWTEEPGRLQSMGSQKVRHAEVT